jgi:FAD/FMN-containing dehydrogenase
VLSEGSAAYDNFTSDYWAAQQAAVDPFCVFKPSNAVQVSTVVLLSRLTQCPFAVKGGGHAAFAGGSSIEGGITIALEKLNVKSLSLDRKIASVGPGNRWGDVYPWIEQYGLQVIGGRVCCFPHLFLFSYPQVAVALLTLCRSLQLVFLA